MVITRGDIERHRMKFTYKMFITCEITALLSLIKVPTLRNVICIYSPIHNSLPLFSVNVHLITVRNSKSAVREGKINEIHTLFIIPIIFA